MKAHQTYRYHKGLQDQKRPTIHPRKQHHVHRCSQNKIQPLVYHKVVHVVQVCVPHDPGVVYIEKLKSNTNTIVPVPTGVTCICISISLHVSNLFFYFFFFFEALFLPPPFCLLRRIGLTCCITFAGCKL